MMHLQGRTIAQQLWNHAWATTSIQHWEVVSCRRFRYPVHILQIYQHHTRLIKTAPQHLHMRGKNAPRSKQQSSPPWQTVDSMLYCRLNAKRCQLKLALLSERPSRVFRVHVHMMGVVQISITNGVSRSCLSNASQAEMAIWSSHPTISRKINARKEAWTSESTGNASNYALEYIVWQTGSFKH